MPLSIDQLNSITKKHIAPRIGDNLFNAIPLFHRLREQRKELVAPGVKITEPIIYQGTGQAGGFTGDGPLPTTSQEHLTSAEFDLVTYQVPIVVSNRQLMDNSGPNGVHKLLSTVQMVAELDLQDQIGGDLFTGNGSSVDANALDGLDLMVDDNDTPKSYGGISVSDFAGWAADDTGSFGAITLLKIQKMLGRVTFGTDRPSLIVCTQDIFDKTWSLLQAQQEFRSEKEGDAGFQMLRVSGIPMMVDSKCPEASASDQTMYALNEKYLYLYTHPQANMLVRPFQEPENSWNKVSHIIHAIQLVTNNRRMHARVTGVDPTA